LFRSCRLSAILVSLLSESKETEEQMLAKLSAKNQLTLPKAILDEVETASYFEVSAEHGRIVLTPVRISQIDAVRVKLQQLGITERDVEDAVRWARENP
jgi:UDP-N-acetylglucosamine enolpyruvyl transferase